MHLHILTDIQNQFHHLIPVLATQVEAVTLSSCNIKLGYNTYVLVSATPPVCYIDTDFMKTQRNVEIDVDGKQAQIHFNDKFSLTLPSEHLELSTIYTIIDQIKQLIEYIERIHNGPNTD